MTAMTTRSSTNVKPVPLRAVDNAAFVVNRFIRFIDHH